MHTRRQRWRRVLRRAAPLVLGVGTLGSIAFWLALEHQPAWYKPAVLDEHGVQTARRGASNAVDRFGDQLVLRQPFEIVITDEAVNTWLSAMPHIWPDAARALPSELRDPAVGFEPGVLRIGVLYDVNGWRAIVSSSVTASITAGSEAVDLRLVDARCGSVRVPRWLLTRLVDPQLQQTAPRPGVAHSLEPAYAEHMLSSLRELRTVNQLQEGVRIRNRFLWPNGKRPFRLDQITIETGRLRLRIEPL